MIPPIWLDSSALLTWYRGEPGCDVVLRVVTRAERGTHPVCIAQITLLEIAQAVARERGEMAARENIKLLRELAIEFVPATNEQCVAAGLLRTSVGLSTADALIAIQAMAIGAELMHQDPEFDSVPGLRHRRLPYKKPARAR